MQAERQRMGIPCADPGHARSGDGELAATQSTPSGVHTDAAFEYDANRAIIEQAKGMLMFMYGIDADEAFQRLREQSQQHNVKLRLIAQQVSKDLVGLARTSSSSRRMEHDLLLRTAHQRISDAAVRHSDAEAELGGRHA
jgi:methylaspartate ammonia-lyase